MGIVDEMITEMVDEGLNNPDLEDEADEEVTKVLDEVLAGKTNLHPLHPQYQSF